MVFELTAKRLDARGYEQCVIKIDSCYGLEDLDRATLESEIQWELGDRDFELVALECDGVNWFVVIYLESSEERDYQWK